MAGTWNTSVALVSFAALSLAACGDDSAVDPDAGSQSSGASSTGSGGEGGGPPTEDPADWLDRSLRDQVAALEAGIITSAGLTQAYLDRIAEIDEGDAGIHAVLAPNPDALDTAAELDASRRVGALLQGAPILVKDNIDTADLATTAGSLAMIDNVPSADATTVASLRAARGLMFGKANLSEWANFRGFQSSSGWSSLGGQTTNGFDPAYNPSGSSSGSAAAVAAGLASAALGTETVGSVTSPSTVNGVVGFKPTVGLVSRAGVIPISETQDTVGPITRTVGDAARLMTVLAGPDPADPATDAIPPSLDLDFEAPLRNATVRGKRLGVFTYIVQSAVGDVFDAERARLEAAGAITVDVQLNQAAIWPHAYTAALYEFKAGINAYLSSHPGGPATLADLIAFNDDNAATVMPFFGQEVFLEAEATTNLMDPEYVAARQAAQQAAGPDGIDAALAADDLDALIAPTGRTAWKTNHANGDPSFGDATGLPAVAGYPHLTVPMGLADGLPAGMSFIGAAWTDAEILALGHAYESLPR